MAGRRKQAAPCLQIAEEERVVRDDDIGRLGSPACTVHETKLAKERAFPLEALAALGGEEVARERTVIDLERVEVVKLALLDV